MKQIIAMGGGGFSMEPDNIRLDYYALAQTQKENPVICFLPTASAESPKYINDFYTAFTRLNCRPRHLSLFNLPSTDLEGYVMECDLIYVGGGNTRSMLALWREWNLDVILHKAWEKGVVMAGLSAGAICWFSHGVTDAVPGRFMSMQSTGFLRGSCNPHYDLPSERRTVFHQMISSGELPGGYGIDNYAALHFIDQKLEVVICSQEGKAAYEVSLEAGEVLEQCLNSVLLDENGSLPTK